MARFVFKLQALLQHRLALEDRAQRELAKTMRQRLILQSQLQQMQQTITRSRHDLTRGLVGQVEVDRVLDFARYSGQVADRARRIVGKIAELDALARSQREVLAGAVRQRQAVELLRDRQLEQWKLDQSRRETTELDEVAAQRYTRRMLADAAVEQQT